MQLREALNFISGLQTLYKQTLVSLIERDEYEKINSLVAISSLVKDVSETSATLNTALDQLPDEIKAMLLIETGPANFVPASPKQKKPLRPKKVHVEQENQKEKITGKRKRRGRPPKASTLRKRRDEARQLVYEALDKPENLEKSNRQIAAVLNRRHQDLQISAQMVSAFRTTRK